MAFRFYCKNYFSTIMLKWFQINQLRSIRSIMSAISKYNRCYFCSWFDLWPLPLNVKQKLQICIVRYVFVFEATWWWKETDSLRSAYRIEEEWWWSRWGLERVSILYQIRPGQGVGYRPLFGVDERRDALQRYARRSWNFTLLTEAPKSSKVHTPVRRVSRLLWVFVLIFQKLKREVIRRRFSPSIFGETRKSQH